MYKFSSESVSEGHPDKVADLISDSIANYIIDCNEASRAAIETLVTTNMVTLAGEYKSSIDVSKYEIERIVRSTVRDIGYAQAGFNWENLKIYNELHGQSADIALGTDNFGAGDQGLMFGYACNETPEFMPATLFYAHKLLKGLAVARRTQPLYAQIGPDSKCQITANYSNTGQLIDFDTILLSTQHTEDCKHSRLVAIITDYIKNSGIPEHLLTEKTKILVNPTGRFVIGGPDGDTGLTGRKIVVDTYGGHAPHGGGAFSGKDPTKVDRSAAYMARWIAKNACDRYQYKKCLVQLSYAIGCEQPLSVFVLSDGQVDHELMERLRREVDLSPRGIIDRFDLFQVWLPSTTNYGHFGRTGLPWENLNL